LVRQRHNGIDMAASGEPEFFGKYRVQREIGKGATATVYLCEDPDRPDPVAVKVISFVDRARDEGKWTRRLMKLFRTEWQVVRRLDHPNIIKIFDMAADEEKAYLAMEFFEGTSLEHYCSFDRMLPLHRAVSAVFKCAMALDYAFRLGVVHRDIKPANILINKNFEVKITDFGLALDTLKKSETDSTFIMGVGSPAYMSPEQIKGYPLNQKTDLYSLGVVLFHLLTGRLPFRGRNPAQLVYRIINADPPSVSQLNPDVPQQMDAIIRKALEKDLYSRYRNGAEFAKDLTAVRFQIIDDDYVPTDMSRFAVLRKMPFFLEFEDVEIWETLRISSWRQIPESTLLMREGEQDKRFGLIIDGEVEVSVEGKRICTLGAGEVVGELAYLDYFEGRRSATVVSITSLIYLDVSPQALALASEECLEHFNQRLTSVAMKRMADTDRRLAKFSEPAQQTASLSQITFELSLSDDATPMG
jgi:non-specific serine/threonine protein kinase